MSTRKRTSAGTPKRRTRARSTGARAKPPERPSESPEPEDLIARVRAQVTPLGRVEGAASAGTRHRLGYDYEEKVRALAQSYRPWVSSPNGSGLLAEAAWTQRLRERPPKPYGRGRRLRGLHFG